MSLNTLYNEMVELEKTASPDDGQYEDQSETAAQDEGQSMEDIAASYVEAGREMARNDFARMLAEQQE